MKYSQEEQDQILRRINAGVIGKRKQGTWDRMVKMTTITKKQCLEEALKYNRKSDWQQASAPTYLVSRKRGWFEECSAHMDEYFTVWTKEYVRETLKGDFKSFTDYTKTYGNREVLERLDMVEEVKSLFPNLRKRLTLEDVRKEALKYTTRGKFCKDSGAAYEWARKRKILDDVCSHMTKKSKK